LTVEVPFIRRTRSAHNICIFPGCAYLATTGQQAAVRNSGSRHPHIAVHPRAAGQLRYGLALAERLPKLGALFAAGDVDFRVISAVVFRIELITDDATLTRLDGWLARNTSR
jgi:hypothetical protein